MQVIELAKNVILKIKKGEKLSVLRISATK